MGYEHTSGRHASGTLPTGETEPVRVELYVRSLAPCGARETQEAIVDRLCSLEREGVVDELDLEVWGNAVCVDGAAARVGAGRTVVERILAFEDWAANRDASLEPYFTWAAVDSSMAGERYERVVPPHRCMAVYVQDRLRRIYPCTVGGESRSVTDGLELLEERRSRVTDPVPVTEE